MRKHGIILALVLSASVLSLQAQEGWTLRRCIEYAIENNLSIKRSENAVSQSEVEQNTSKWARLPNLNAGAGQNFNWGRTSIPKKNDETGNYDNVYVNTSSRGTSFSLSTNVPLFTGFELPNQLSLAKLNLKAATADLEKAKDDLALNIASTYVQVLYNNELNKIAKEQVELSKSQLSRVKRLYEVGKASPAEVAELKARLSQDEMSSVQAENNYRLSLLDLSQLLELPTPEGFSIDTSGVENLTFSPLTPPDEVYMLAATEKPEIQAAQFRLEGSEKSIRIAQSAYYPSLSLNASLGTNYYSTLNRTLSQQMKDNFSKYIGLNLSIPIFNRFATRNRVRSARLQQSNYTIQLDEAKKGLYKEIQQAWYSAVAAESKFNTSEAAVDANEEAFQLMSEKFENGKATSIEYNEAKLNLMKALSDQVQAKYDYIFRSKVLDFYKGIPIE